MQEGFPQRKDRQNGSCRGGPQTDKQKYSYNSGEHIQYGWSNRRTAAECHPSVKHQGDACNHSLQEKAEARRTVGES
jgi:hypothetical protein